MSKPLFPLIEPGPFWTIGERDPEVDDRQFPEWSWFLPDASYHRTPEEAECEREVLAAQLGRDLVIVGPLPWLWRARCLTCGETVGDPDRRYESWEWVRDAASAYGDGDWLVDDEQELLWHNSCAPDGFRFELTADDQVWLAGIGDGIADTPPMQPEGLSETARVLQAAAAGELTGLNQNTLADWRKLFQHPVRIGGRKATRAECVAAADLVRSGDLVYVGCRITATAKGRELLETSDWARRQFIPRRNGGEKR